MAKVNLTKEFFGPDNTLYSPRDNPHTFPDSWKLPKGTKPVEAAKVEEEVAKPEAAKPKAK